MEGDRSLSRIYSSPDFIPRNIPAVERVKGPPRKSIGASPQGKGWLPEWKRLEVFRETAGFPSWKECVPV